MHWLVLVLVLVDVVVDDVLLPGRGQLEHRRNSQFRRWIYCSCRFFKQVIPINVAHYHVIINMKIMKICNEFV